MSNLPGRPGRIAPGGLRRLARRGAILVVVGLFVYFAVSVVQVLSAARVSQEPYAVGRTTFIVVMGEHANTSSVSVDTEARLAQAMTLFDADSGRRILIGVLPESGRTGGGAARFLEKQGLPARDLTVVTATSDDSLLAMVRRVVGDRRPTPVIIVTDPLDDLRLRGDAASYGLTPEISPASPSSTGLFGDILTTGQQAWAVALGRVFGFSTTGWASS
jgi:uncharacterized SAM-binding protein YcdF (DUF218 family)